MKKITGFTSIAFISTGIMLVCGALIFSTLFFKKTKNRVKHNLFVQLPLNIEAIKKLQRNLDPVIDKIIQEELGVKQDKNLPIFFFKKRQAITVYYINDAYDNGENFLFTQLDVLRIKSVPKNVTIKSEVAFFGGTEAQLIDLVGFIDDLSGELLALNKEIKPSVYRVNEEYKKLYHFNFYDIAKSEQFSFKPHISLGHLRLNSIKSLFKDPLIANSIIERIKQRIMNIVSQALLQLTVDERKILFDKLCIYDQQKREYIKEYNF